MTDLTKRLWDKRRELLVKTLRETALALFEHTNSHDFCIDLDPPHGKLFVAAGTAEGIVKEVRAAGEPIEDGP